MKSYLLKIKVLHPATALATALAALLAAAAALTV